MSGDAGPHQDVVDAGENRTTQRGGRRELDLGEEIDSDEAVVPHLGELYFDEGSQHDRVDGTTLADVRQCREAAIRRRTRSSHGAEFVDDVGNDTLSREAVEGGL